MLNLNRFVDFYLVFILIGLSALFLVILIWEVMLSLKIRKFKKEIAAFFSGSKVENIEQLVLDQSKTLKLLDKDIQELFTISNQINNLAHRGLSRFGIVRFNPFRDVGGDQSFAIALLNGKSNGIVISSLYTREGTRIYSKNIIAGKSEKHPLTEEEKQAIELALKSKNENLKTKSNG